jgi:hypothetical protein
MMKLEVPGYLAQLAYSKAIMAGVAVEETEILLSHFRRSFSAEASIVLDLVLPRRPCRRA